LAGVFKVTIIHYSVTWFCAGIDFKLKTFTVQGKRIRLQIWDTAGQERFETLTAQYYRRAQGILLVYDITQEQTFGNVSKWLRNIEENAVEDVKLLLVGNKVDLEQQRQVTVRRGEKLAKQHGITFMETSAWTNVNIASAFTTLTKEILEATEHKIQVQRGEGEGNGTLGRSKIVLGTGQSYEDPGEGGGGSCWC